MGYLLNKFLLSPSYIKTAFTKYDSPLKNWNVLHDTLLCSSSDIWRVQKIEVWHFQMLKSFRKLSYIFPRKWGVMTWKSQHEMLLLEEEERKRRRMPIITCPLSLLVQLVVWKSPVDHLLSTHLDLLQTQVSPSIVRLKVDFYKN